MILAGDIGGTHARLAFFDVRDGHLNPVSLSVFPSREYSGLDEIVSKFLSSSPLRPDQACFGVAGPVRNGRIEASNLPWIIETKRLVAEIKLDHITLINDLEANAWGIPELAPEDLVLLNRTSGTPVGNQAVISAGTGSPAWPSTTISAFCRRNVDLPAILGPVSSSTRCSGDRSQSFGTNCA